MLSGSVLEGLSHVRRGIERLSAGDSTDASEISLNRRSCALRVALPTLLLLSSLGLRSYPPYVTTTLGRVAFGGSLFFADRIGPKRDSAISGLQVGVALLLSVSSLVQLSMNWGKDAFAFYIPVGTLVVSSGFLIFKETIPENLNVMDGVTWLSHLHFLLAFAFFLPPLVTGGFEDLSLSTKLLTSSIALNLFPLIEFRLRAKRELLTQANFSSGWLIFGACLLGVVLSFAAFQESQALLGQLVNLALFSAYAIGPIALLRMAQKVGANA